MSLRGGGCLRIPVYQIVGGATPGVIFRVEVDPPGV